MSGTARTLCTNGDGASPHVCPVDEIAKPPRVPGDPSRTFATAAEARAFIEANASLPSGTLAEALDRITRHAWATGVEARALTEKNLVVALSAFLARPDHIRSSSHGEAVQLLGRALEVLGGDLCK